MRRPSILLPALAVMILLAGASALAQGNWFAGVWRAYVANLAGTPAWVELVMMPDGSFQQQTRTQGGALITIMGGYRVFAEQGVLRLDIRNYEPKRWCGPLGCNPIYMPDGETHYYRFNGPNMLTLQIMTGGQAIQYRRAQ
jgi:hypothetical protein